LFRGLVDSTSNRREALTLYGIVLRADLSEWILPFLDNFDILGSYLPVGRKDLHDSKEIFKLLDSRNSPIFPPLIEISFRFGSKSPPSTRAHVFYEGLPLFGISREITGRTLSILYLTNEPIEPRYVE
jgi:hypothetical protein